MGLTFVSSLSRGRGPAVVMLVSSAPAFLFRFVPTTPPHPPPIHSLPPPPQTANTLKAQPFSCWRRGTYRRVSGACRPRSVSGSDATAVPSGGAITFHYGRKYMVAGVSIYNANGPCMSVQSSVLYQRQKKYSRLVP